MKTYRAGKFSISLDMIDKYPITIKKVMGECIIVKAEIDYLSNTIEYTALSDWFEEVAENQCPMYYSIKCIKDKYNNIKWMFQEGHRYHCYISKDEFIL